MPDPLPAALCALTALCLPLGVASAGPLLNQEIGFSGAALHLSRYAAPSGDRRIISMTTQPGGSADRSLFVTSQDGSVHRVVDSGRGSGASTEWFNYNRAVSQARRNASDGFVLASPTDAHGGLRSVAFHPDFATNGLFYTSAMVDRPSPRRREGIRYLGNSPAGFDAESVVAEWAYDASSGSVRSESYRELFRVPMPVFDHAIKQITFNNHARPGDEDHGLLYVAHGDGSVQSATAGGGQRRDDALGKVLRINPLASGASPYTTPGSAFADDPDTLDEIFTLGHRNPHHLSFARDAGGKSHVIAAEVGRDNIEEINLLTGGGDYGWSSREGTFVHRESGGSIVGVSPLPADDWENGYHFPSAQYEHNSRPGSGLVGSAVSGAFVLDNGADEALDGQYVFADFGRANGFAYHTGFEGLLGAHTVLGEGESPEALTQAEIFRLKLTIDLDGDGDIDRRADDFNTLLGRGRNDVRFGRGAGGELYVSSKQTGLVYLVTNTVAVPEPATAALLGLGLAGVLGRRRS